MLSSAILRLFYIEEQGRLASFPITSHWPLLPFITRTIIYFLLYPYLGTFLWPLWLADSLSLSFLSGPCCRIEDVHGPWCPHQFSSRGQMVQATGMGQDCQPFHLKIFLPLYSSLQLGEREPISARLRDSPHLFSDL